MSKKIRSGRVAQDHTYFHIGDVAQVHTEDGTDYVFRKARWEDKWYFSHRSTWDDDGYNENEKNHQLPESVEEWADTNLGEWGFFTGRPEYEAEVCDDHIKIRNNSQE